MLHRLRVQGFKSLRDVDVRLGRLTLVFGANGSGKSNLLEAMRLFAAVVHHGMANEAFADVRGDALESFSFGAQGLAGLLARDTVKMTIAATTVAAEGDPSDFQLTLGGRPRTGVLGVLEPTDDGDPGFVSKVSERPVWPHLDEYAAVRFPSNPSVVAMREEVAAWSFVHLDPRAGMRNAQGLRHVEGIGERGEWLGPFLYRLQNDPQYRNVFDAIVRTLWGLVPAIDGVETKLDEEQGRISLRIQQHGVWMSSRVVSDGTLRALALCCMVMNPFHKGLLAIEEPENGVHPKQIELIATLLAHAAKERQVIATTHSPLLVAEIVRMIRAGDLAEADVALLGCRGGPDGSHFTRVDVGSLRLDDPDVRDAFAANDERAVVEGMIRRGWLDG